MDIKHYVYLLWTISTMFTYRGCPSFFGDFTAQELCKSRGGHPGLPLLNKTVSAAQHLKKTVACLPSLRRLLGVASLSARKHDAGQTMSDDKFVQRKIVV